MNKRYLILHAHFRSPHKFLNQQMMTYIIYVTRFYMYSLDINNACIINVHYSTVSFELFQTNKANLVIPEIIRWSSKEMQVTASWCP